MSSLDPNQQYYGGYPQGGGGPYPQPGGGSYPQPGGFQPPPPGAGYPGFMPQPGFEQPPHSGVMMGDNGSNYMYNDPEHSKNFGFDTESIRRGFIRKVYLILMVRWSSVPQMLLN